MRARADIYDADYARRIGLINEICNSDALPDRVMDVAQRIASKSQGAIKRGKAAFGVQRAMSLEDSYAYCSAIMVQNMLDGSACEGLAAFIEKRNPIWPSS
jgi:enoyl-CoA hydratase/carnithine racemase